MDSRNPEAYAISNIWAEQPGDRPHPPPPAARHPRLQEGQHRTARRDDPDVHTNVRSGDFLADAKIAWRDAYDMQSRTAIRPLAQAAE
jgi:hypothetical protein